VTTTLPSPASTAGTITTRNRVGIGLAVVAGLIDVIGLAALGVTPAPGEQGPPDAVLALGAALGTVTIAAATYAWIRRSRAGLRVAAATRLLSMVLALPAFVVDGVPAPVVALTAVSLLVTLATVALLMSRR
jgi:hypothetical protein